MIPTKWSDLTVGDFIKIMPVLNSTEYDNNIEKLIDVAAILSGGLNQSISEISKLNFLSDLSSLETKVPKYFYFKGKFYKPVTNFRSIIGGQYIDLSSYCKEQEKIMQNIHYLSAIVCDEVNWFGFRKKYEGEKLNAKAELFKELPVTVIYPVAVFFCNNLMSLTDATQTYLEAEIVRQATLTTHGVGILTSTLWQRVKEKIGITSPRLKSQP